jgi:threonine dehydrogenase-like Zn-dependent dehydrogenase
VRGVVFLGNGTLEVKNFPDYELDPVQVLVGMKASGICGSDLHFFHHTESPKVIQGHEPAGVVVQVGVGVKSIRVGDRVLVYHARGCGNCRQCLAGHYMQCPSRRGMGWHINGSHADYVLTEEKYCLHLPDQLDFADGAILSCGGGTAYAMLNKMDLSPGGLLLLFGAGPLGLCVTLLAKAQGTKVLLVDVNRERLAFAREHGADNTIDASSTEVVNDVMELTNGQGIMKIIDTSGSTQARNTAIHCAAVNGKIGILGMRNPDNRLDLDPFIRKQLTLIGSYVFPITMYPEIRDFLLEHEVHFSDIVSRTFALEEADAAYRLFETGTVGKLMFVWIDTNDRR